MTVFWFGTFIFLLIVEIVTVNLVTIWFALGALFAIISSMFTDSFIIQMLVFVFVSLISLIVTKPLLKKFKGFEVTPTNSDRVIGMVGEVTKKIDKNKYGQVQVFGNSWTATSDQVIEVGKKVKVLSIDGVKLIVKKEEE